MATFDLDRFRDLAFGRKPLPDHPMQSVAEAKKLLALLPEDDADHALAELTNWASTMNLTESFSPGRRARVLMLLDDAARPYWRVLGQQYLAPNGQPTEARDGDARILRAMFDSASEFANGFGIALDTSARDSRWVEQNRTRLVIRNLRWLGRRLALAYMLHLPVTNAIWERLHLLYRLATDGEFERETLPAFEGVSYKTSVKREYTRSLLLELANPTSLHAREIELVYRIAARIASSVQLEPERSDGAPFAVIPAGNSRPTLVKNLKPSRTQPLYLSVGNALPRLRAALERDAGRDASDEDALYGRGYTIRERNALLRRLIDHWGFDPPQRRTRRIGMATPVRLFVGYEHVLNVLPALDKAQVSGESRSKLRLLLDQTSKSLKRATLKVARDWRGHLTDASTGGMGIAIAAAGADWAKHQALVAILIEPGTDWVVGVLKRIYSVDDELRLGVQVLAGKPRVLWLETDMIARESVWEDAMRHESSFGDRFQRAILLEPLPTPLTSGEFLLPPRAVSKGAQFEVPLPSGDQRIRVARLNYDGEHYQRAAFEAMESAVPKKRA